MTEFLYPLVFILLPLPFLMPYLLTPVGHKNQDALKVPFFDAVAALPASGRFAFAGSPKIRRVLAVIIWILLVTAAARPQWAGAPARLPSEGRNIVLALDMSGSMAEKDFVLNQTLISRWEAVKRVASQFIQKRAGDRIGIVLFGTRAYQFLPLTPDLQTAAEMLREADVGMAGTQTAIGDGLGIALKMLKDTPAKSQIVILLSDGVANAGTVYPQKAADEARKAGVKVYTVGAGSNETELQTLFGAQLIARGDGIDEETLKQIAATTDGVYFRAADTDALNRAYQTVDALEPVSLDAVFVRPVKELFYYPLSVAFILTVLGVALTYLSYREAGA